VIQFLILSNNLFKHKLEALFAEFFYNLSTGLILGTMAIINKRSILERKIKEEKP
jgi:hypothetical protein